MNRIKDKATRDYVGSLEPEEAERLGYSYEQWMDANENLW